MTPNYRVAKERVVARYWVSINNDRAHVQHPNVPGNCVA